MLILAFRAFVFLKKTEVVNLSGQLYFTVKFMHKLGYISGDFFSNASGHPGLGEN
jgi:hypothetical protein